jgi:hypothetical protein
MDMDRVLCEEGTEVLRVIELNIGRGNLGAIEFSARTVLHVVGYLDEGHS